MLEQKFEAANKELADAKSFKLATEKMQPLDEKITMEAKKKESGSAIAETSFNKHNPFYIAQLESINN
jgi:hypothetical protein